MKGELCLNVAALDRSLELPDSAGATPFIVGASYVYAALLGFFVFLYLPGMRL